MSSTCEVLGVQLPDIYFSAFSTIDVNSTLKIMTLESGSVREEHSIDAKSDDTK